MIRAIAAILLIPLIACNNECATDLSATAAALDSEATEAEACCLVAATPEAELALCSTHPFGRAIECGPEERPQTGEKCQAILRMNDGICVSDYIACRDDIRVAACDECPETCADVVGACAP